MVFYSLFGAYMPAGGRSRGGCMRVYMSTATYAYSNIIIHFSFKLYFRFYFVHRRYTSGK